MKETVIYNFQIEIIIFIGLESIAEVHDTFEGNSDRKQSERDATKKTLSMISKIKEENSDIPGLNINAKVTESSTGRLVSIYADD